MYGIKDCKRNIAPWSVVAGEFLTAKKDHNNHGQKSWDPFAFLRRFLFCKGPTPPLTPQTKLDMCIQDFFQVSTLLQAGGEGELQENFEKDARFYEGTQKLQKNMNTALLSH